LYTITPIVRARVFESNEAWRASQNADHTSRSHSVVEFGQPADVAAQPNLGLLPERGPGAGSGNPARAVASWKNLKLATHDEVSSKTRSLDLVRYGYAHTAAFAVWVSKFNGSKLSAFEAREPEALVQSKEHKEAYMFIVLFAILLLAWLGGFLVFHISSALIHILLLFAVISLIAHLFQRKTVS